VLTEEEGALLMRGRQGEKEAAEKKKEGEIKGSFKDGITWESGDKAHKISVNGRVQLDYRDFSNDELDKTKDGFDVRRAYLGVSGQFAKYYDFKVVANFAEADDVKDKSNQLDEAYFGINWWKQASFRFGQFKMPFSLEEQISSRFIDFQERSLANKLVPGKEIGAMVHGEPIKGMFYALAFSTGEGRSKIEKANDEGSEIIARVGANIADLMGGSENNVYHIAAAGSWGSDPGNAIKAEANSESKGTTFFSATLPVDTERDRYGVEGAVGLGPVKLQAEWIKNKYDLASGSNVDIDTWYAEALWMITGEKYASAYKGGKFDRMKPFNNFNPDGQGMGAWEIGMRYSDWDASDFASKGVAFTGTDEADSLTVGLKWIPMPNARFLLNYVRTDYDDAVNGKDDEKAITFRTQFDF
jgi:phosphate-selective porin OprO/OprP